MKCIIMHEMRDPVGDALHTALGERLRARRLHLGLTQAALAESAQVSARFLVQMEQGEANPSVSSLAAVCAALDLPLESLFAGLGPGRPEKVALVGLRGAGKSTVGAALATQLGVRFVELDRAVEEAAGMSLGEIFELRGESSYRELEAAVVDAALSAPGPAVLAAGGSVVSSERTWAQLRQRALTVWLRASPGAHLHRVRAQGDLRPMAGRPDALGELTEILRERTPLYAQATLTLDTEVLGVAGTVQRLAAELGRPVA